MPLLENLPVDTEIPPEVRESFMQTFLGRLEDALWDETTWAITGGVMIFLIVRRSVTSFTDARVRKAEALRRLSLEDEVQVGLELQKLRHARQGGPVQDA